METFKQIFYYLILVISVIGGILAVIILPEEGHTVLYRLEDSSNSEVGRYPLVREVIENGVDMYIHFPDLTMEEGVELVKQMNADLKNKP